MRTELFLNICSQKNVSYLLERGYCWFDGILLPMIQDVNHSGVSTENLSDLYYLIGDVYDMTSAPLKALYWYEESILIDSSNYAAYREAANMLEQVGDYERACIYINKALEIDPTDECSIQDKECIYSSKQTNSDPLYIKGDMVWEMNELLAGKEFSEILNCLKGKDNVELLKILARAYGALKDEAKYMETWYKISESGEDIYIDYADWFYLPLNLKKSKAFWLFLKSINDKIKPSVFYNFDSLNEHYNLPIPEKRLLTCDYNIYLLDRNYEALSEMKQKYPEWIELHKY